MTPGEDRSGDGTARRDDDRGGESPQDGERGGTGGRDDHLKHLPLEDEHVALGARFAAFGGWRMPTVYTSIIDEHFQVRTSAGLFDVSHMGRFLLRGLDSLRTMQRLVASDLGDLEVGEARYTVLLTPWGGIRDDLIVYRRDDGLLLVVNAGNADGDREWIQDHLVGDTILDDLTDITCLIAFQGPAALPFLDQLTATPISTLPPFTFTSTAVGGVESTVMRTGYTGEHGVEIMMQHTEASRLWHALLTAGRPGAVAPCGLGARDTLRLEAGLLLHGQDMDQSTTPYEARLGWLTELERGDASDFVGREALLEARATGPSRILAGLATEVRTIPRPGDLLLVDGAEVGTITSGAPSPVLGHPIAFGYLPPALAEIGTEVVVRSAGGKLTPARVVARPFYRRGETPVPESPRRRRPTSRRPEGDR